MENYKVEDIRNIAFCGHGGAGKTTLADKLLTSTKTLNKVASVDNGTSICDFDDLEKEHKYSIEASLIHFDSGGKHYNVIDTPGYPDFIGQVIGALRAVETVAVVINAQAGIEANTRRVFTEAGNVGLGRVIVINRLDGENIDFKLLLANIKDTFGNTCVPLNIPLGLGQDFKGVASTLQIPDDTSGAIIEPAEIQEPLMDSIVEVDEAVMERYLEGTPPTTEELAKLIVQAVAEGSLIPILCVSGRTGVGVPELIESFSMCALSPDRIKRTAKNRSGDEVELVAEASAPLAAQVFKTRIDPFVQKISFIRIFSGGLAKDSTVATDESRKGIKLSQLFRIQANETKPITVAGPGEIVAVTKMEELKTGTTLGEVILPEIKFPTPMIGLAVRPKSRGDEGKLSGSINKVTQEDRTFKVDHDPQTKELVMTGMSELHLQIVREKLANRNKVEVETKEPKIPYRETIKVKGDGSYRHKKQTGGHGQFAEVHVHMFPLPKDTNIDEFAIKSRFPQMKDKTYVKNNNFLWINSVVGGSIPSNFLPAIEKGFFERLEKGVIAGYMVQDVCINVHFGKSHSVDSSEAAFKIASSMVFRNVFLECKPALLEPIVKIDVTAPDSNVGDITSDMSSRRGQLLGMEPVGGGMQVIKAVVPLAEVTTYARALSSITGGQGSFVLEFSHYDFVLPSIQKEIVEKAEKAKAEQ